MSILFAATYPDKVSSLILGSGFARWFPAPDYRCGPAAEQVYASMREIATHRWGHGATIDWYLPSRSSSSHARELLGRFERIAISPSAFLRMLRMIAETDVRAVLPAIHVPTLVIQRLGDRINPPLLRPLLGIPYRRRSLLRAAGRPRPPVRRRWRSGSAVRRDRGFPSGRAACGRSSPRASHDSGGGGDGRRGEQSRRPRPSPRPSARCGHRHNQAAGALAPRPCAQQRWSEPARHLRRTRASNSLRRRHSRRRSGPRNRATRRDPHRRGGPGRRGDRRDLNSVRHR